MKPFLNEDFLLGSETARFLYHEAAEKMPIYDFHCHLSPRSIAENERFRNIGHLMLGGDHYKWRAMAAFGIEEDLIRGGASDHDKFLAYAGMMPYAIGNPLYHWTHMELKRTFGIDDVLSARSAEDIWRRANALLETEEYRARGLIEKFHVRVLCTTDDPIDSLEYHKQIAEDPNFSVCVRPAFRPDKAINVDRAGFADYIAALARATGRKIKDTEGVIEALKDRVEYFHQAGARLSDHALDVVPYQDADMKKADKAFLAAMKGEEVEAKQAEHYRTALLTALGAMYKERGWAQQYHMNALRNNNRPGFKRYGPDTGFDSVGDTAIANKLSRLLDAQARKDQLPKTVLYTLNPAANYALASMTGNFQMPGTPGYIQFGSGWWFCDQKEGMLDQLKSLSAIGLLSGFVGMLTDSRSFISYPRHEYFRRILCDLIGSWVENGEYPSDTDTLTEIVRNICYGNAERYFGAPDK